MSSVAPDAAPKPRPKIGLVLSGGGARGITHIGVLKVLEKLRIPVDYIAATSMGAVVGGLYASGMAPAEMEKQINAVSWPTLLSDSPARRDVGFRVKEEDAQFPLGFELGFRDGQFRAFKGALSGSNLELFLHELTRSVDNVATFDQLPIPFRAIATDMVTGREVVFDRGPIYQAMRASMSVPGMFTPAEIDGRILGDGGLVNNLPVDVVARDGRRHRDRGEHRHAAHVPRPAVVGPGLHGADGQHPHRAERARAAGVAASRATSSSRPT